MKRRYGTYLFLSLLLAFGGLAAVLLTGTSPRLGLDLEGGLSVILSAEGEEVNQGVLQKTVDIIRQRIDALGVSEPEVSIAGTNNILIQLPGVEDEQKALELIGTTAQLTFRQVEEIIPPNKKKPPPITEDTSAQVNEEEVVYPSADPSEEGTLYRLKPAALTGDVVTRAEAVTQDGVSWEVAINMNDDGSSRWEDLTGRLACLRDEGEAVKSRIAIVLDGQVEAAPEMARPGEGGGEGVVCNEGIGGGETSITTGGEPESKDLALILKTGALPLTLTQSEVRKVSPTLGRDSLNAGITAGAIGLVLVMIYMVLYYRALGLVVWVGLAIFTAILYTIMAILGETAGLSLSLAGVAGVIVSVGVTADSYIVAFERLKDEAHAGKSIRAAVDRGMARAFRTILVADAVTGAAALILFWLAVGPVKGFALTLGLATIADILIAYFYTRSAVNLLARTRFFNETPFIGLRDALGIRA